MAFYKRNIIIGGFLLVVLLGLYFFFQDSLPPRTPHKIARTISGLNIENSFKVDEFKDNLQGGTGTVPSGDLLIEFTLENEQLEMLQKECEQKKYKSLPVKDFLYTPDFIVEADKGLYWLDEGSSDPLDFSLIVLSFTQKKLYVYLSDS